MSIVSMNPYTGEVLKKFSPLSVTEIEKKMDLAWSRYQKTLSHLEESQKSRMRRLLRLAEILEQEKEKLAPVLTQEMGKPLKQSIQEIEKCALNCRYYAETGLNGLKPLSIDFPQTASTKSKAEIQYLPIGIILAVMPWNFPFWQVIRGAAPILLSGNSILLKHASNVPECALALERLFLDAGFEEGCFQTLLIGSDQIASLIQDDRVQGVTLTGSEGAGRDVASKAGQAIKKTVLELGGSDPFIVMTSADIKNAAETAVKARLINNGQSCIAAKRFIIHEQVYSEFVDIFVEKMKASRMGDPMKLDTDLGPLVSKQACKDLHDLVQDAVKEGAKILLGGILPEEKGAFYPATVLENIPLTAQLRQEEAFGPVAQLYRVKSFQEAIERANSTRFALASSFWSHDSSEIKAAISLIQAGSVFVNTMVASDPHLPFGGIKSSGYGRELSQVGLHEFTNIKTIVQA